MDSNFDGLRRFFDKLKTLGFIERLFSWRSVQEDLISANGELQRLLAAAEQMKTENSRLVNMATTDKADIKNLLGINHRTDLDLNLLKQQHSVVAKQNEERLQQLTELSSENRSYLKRGTELSNELAVARQKLESMDSELQKLRSENAQMKKTEEFKTQQQHEALSSFKQLQDDLKRDREQEIVAKKNQEIDRLKKLKETWLNHESNVKQRIKTISSRHTVDYIDKVPFRGSPDNTLKINEEYVIFDAKSPAGDDLSNFNTYLKAQAENAIKYVKEEGVKREIFLVVPTNTLEKIEYFQYRLADYTVYIISVDSLEPVIITLQRIEQYEFADQLSPEERENICRVIGKFLHLSKRRIQIDGFFAKQFFELVYRSEAELPKDLLEKVVEFERSEKINPPTEKRAKQINVKELEIDSEKQNAEAKRRGIIIEQALMTKEINKLPLYTIEGEEQPTEQGSLFKE